MLDATSLKAHRTASSLNKGGEEPELIGPTLRGTDQQTPCGVRHARAYCAASPQPEAVHSDFTGADVLLRDFPGATALMGDKEYDSNKVPHHAEGVRHPALHPAQAEP